MTYIKKIDKKILVRCHDSLKTYILDLAKIIAYARDAADKDSGKIQPFNTLVEQIMQCTGASDSDEYYVQVYTDFIEIISVMCGLAGFESIKKIVEVSSETIDYLNDNSLKKSKIKAKYMEISLTYILCLKDIATKLGSMKF